LNDALPLGHRYDVPAIPAVPEDTTYIAAGPITIGVEYRRVTDAIIQNAIAEDSEQSASADAGSDDAVLDEGVAIHVHDSASQDEYVRFDWFLETPHYHYIVPRSHNIIIAYDSAAHGSYHDWMFRCLSTRLPEMLREAGAVELASRVDVKAMEAALPAIQKEIDQALASSGSQLANA
jgi:hypothetical protein